MKKVKLLLEIEIETEVEVSIEDVVKDIPYVTQPLRELGAEVKLKKVDVEELPHNLGFLTPIYASMPFYTEPEKDA